MITSDTYCVESSNRSNQSFSATNNLSAIQEINLNIPQWLGTIIAIRITSPSFLADKV